MAYAGGLAAAHRARPEDDFFSTIVHAEFEGERLDDREAGSYFALLIAAGIGTTATAMSQGVLALLGHPDRYRRWRDDFHGFAEPGVEEVLRWTTPLHNFRRTATRAATLGDQAIAPGEKVVLWYTSANRDESVFEQPFRFDLGRDPNPHLAFGGGGQHFCLGASLARLELCIAFDEIFAGLPDLELDGNPEPLGSMFGNALVSLPCRLSGSGG